MLRFEEILIATPSASRQDIREIVAIARQTGCRVQTLPALHELIDGRVTVNQIRPVRIEDLLGREPVRTDLSACSAYPSGRTVLVTGAGGSIGSELCRPWRSCDRHASRDAPLFHDDSGSGAAGHRGRSACRRRRNPLY